MHEEIFKKSVHSLSDIINTWTGCPLKTAVMFPTKTNALIAHSVMYFLKAKFFIFGIWVGHRIRHAELYLLAENWLLLLTNLLFNDSVSMLFFYSNEYRALNQVIWQVCSLPGKLCWTESGFMKNKKGESTYKMLAFKGERVRKC